MQRFKFMWSYWHCVLLFVSLWFLEILLFLPALERAEIISFSMSTDYKNRSGSCISQTLKEPDCGNLVKTVCRIKDNYNIHYFRLRFPLRHCTWLHRDKCWCLFIVESCWPISAQQCLWFCLKIQRNYILDSSLCLTFFTQHQLWWGEKMNLCLWIINYLKIGLIMAAVTVIYSSFSRTRMTHFMGQKREKREKRKRKEQYISLRCSPSKTNYWSCSSEGCEVASKISSNGAGDAFSHLNFPLGLG